MRLLIVVIASAATVLIGQGPVLAGCRSSGPSLPVGPVSGDPEKDTFGLTCAAADIEQTGFITVSPEAQAMQVGTSTGELEKDTFGFIYASTH